MEKQEDIVNIKRVVLLAIAAATLLAVGIHSQTLNKKPIVGVIFSGGDLRFRVSGIKNGAATGEFVVRVDDKWLPTAPPAIGVQPLQSH
jgi:hypothetical protein